MHSFNPSEATTIDSSWFEFIGESVIDKNIYSGTKKLSSILILILVILIWVLVGFDSLLSYSRNKESMHIFSSYIFRIAFDAIFRKERICFKDVYYTHIIFNWGHIRIQKMGMIKSIANDSLFQEERILLTISITHIPCIFNIGHIRSQKVSGMRKTLFCKWKSSMWYSSKLFPSPHFLKKNVNKILHALQIASTGWSI